MELDLSRTWRIVPSRPRPFPAGSSFSDPLSADDPEDFAAAELAAVLGRISGVPPRAGSGAMGERAMILRVEDDGRADGPGAPAPFSWRAAPDRVEILGGSGPGLVRGVYDFLDALGARWIAPGAGGERLPSGAHLRLATPSRGSPGSGATATLVLGHGAYLERWADYLAWAARAGYASVLVHITRDPLAIGAAPEALYERFRGEIARSARRLGLSLELGGHLLSSFLPRKFFRGEPDLFRMRPVAGRGAARDRAPAGGLERSPDANLCVSAPRALEVAASNFAAFARGHPEIEVFHVWPDDLPGGGWCSCPGCSALPPAAQALKAARALAEALATAARAPTDAPQAGAAPVPRLSFLAYHDTEDLTELDLSGLPGNLELLWAPRRRCWAHGLGEEACRLDAASVAAYRAAASAWRSGGGGRVAVFEYWEDAVLFKGAVPPLARAMAGDLAVYAGRDGASAVGVLLAGGRLPLAPRPNAWLLPRLLRRSGEAGDPGERPEAERADWARAAYGPAAEPMLRYWRALEAAWSLDLELEPGDTEARARQGEWADVDDPPSDWGDPWPAPLERLAIKRGRCEELFERLREAEEALAEALALAENDGQGGDVAARPSADAAGRAAWAEAVRAESREYAISGGLLELDCARLAAYHERAAGDAKSAADIALLAQAPYAALSRAFGALPDPRSRREMRLLLLAGYGLRLGALRRQAAGPAAAAIGRFLAFAELGLRVLGTRRAWARAR